MGFTVNNYCLLFSIFAGLLMFSLIISDIIERFTEADTVIMGDVSYKNLCIFTTFTYYINLSSSLKRELIFYRTEDYTQLKEIKQKVFSKVVWIELNSFDHANCPFTLINYVEFKVKYESTNKLSHSRSRCFEVNDRHFSNVFTELISFLISMIQ